MTETTRSRARNTDEIAVILGVSVRMVTRLLSEKKRPGVPKLEGWRVGSLRFSDDALITKYVDELKRVARGEEVP